MENKKGIKQKAKPEILLSLCSWNILGIRSNHHTSPRGDGDRDAGHITCGVAPEPWGYLRRERLVAAEAAYRDAHLPQQRKGERTLAEEVVVAPRRVVNELESSTERNPEKESRQKRL